MNWETASQLISENTREIVTESICPDPVISVCLITYNQHAFVSDAIDSVLTQVTHCPVEILIGDDHSTDGTTEVVLRYQQRYSDKVRLFLSDSNLGRHVGNGSLNMIRLLLSSRGRYIATIEGDDFWTDPFKLERQLDFLESTPQASGCFHEAITVDHDGKRLPDVFPSGRYHLSYSQKDCLTTLGSAYATASLMFRSHVVARPIPEYYVKAGSDFLLDLMVTEHGTLAYLPFTGAAYRVHKGGLWQGANESTRHLMTLTRLQALRDDATMRARYLEEVKLKMTLAYQRYWSSLKAERVGFHKRFYRCVLALDVFGWITRVKRILLYEFRAVARLFLRHCISLGR